MYLMLWPFFFFHSFFFFFSSDDDGILETESPCLSPLALAACMSIDSCFDPSLIPVFLIQASFELFKVSFFNYFDKRGNFIVSENFVTYVLRWFFIDSSMRMWKQSCYYPVNQSRILFKKVHKLFDSMRATRILFFLFSL